MDRNTYFIGRWNNIPGDEVVILDEGDNWISCKLALQKIYDDKRELFVDRVNKLNLTKEQAEIIKNELESKDVKSIYEYEIMEPEDLFDDRDYCC